MIHFNNETFEKALSEGELMMVDFWAEWCGPCQMQGPVVDEAADEFAGKLKVGKINVDEEGSLAQKYSVMSIPTLILFENGEVIKKEMGFQSLEEIKAMLP